jgi:hypothetical protein
MERMEKQTAVNWLSDNLISEPLSEAHFKHNSECWDKANEMFEQQIIDAHLKGQREDIDFINEAKQEAEQYYNKTFKNK